MTTSIHPWDEGAISASKLSIAVSFLAGFVWFGLHTTPVVPIGSLIVLTQLSRMTGANTWKGRFQFGRAAVLATLAGAVIGFVMKQGVFFAGPGRIVFKLF